MTDPVDNSSETSDSLSHQTVLPVSIRVPRRVFLVLLGLVVLSGVLLFPFPMSSRAWNAAFDLAHAPSFFVAVVVLAAILDPTWIWTAATIAPLVKLNSARLLAIAIGVAAVGAGYELAQAAVGRSPTIADAMANSAGAMSASLLLSCFRRVSNKWRLIFLATGFGLLLLPAIHPLLEFQEAWRAEGEFPLIASFERPRELQGWSTGTAKLERSSEWSSHGSHSLKIESLKTNRQTNAFMNWPPKDWTNCDHLEMTFRNPNSSDVTVSVHVADLQHTQTGYAPTDRFRREFVIPADSQRTIQIPSQDVLSAPETRSADLTQIMFLNVVINKNNDLIVFLDGLKMENSAEK